MRLSRILVPALGLFFAAAMPGIGCELCAVYAAAHGQGVGENGWFTGAAEQFTTFGGMQLGGRDVPNVAGQRIESSTTQFILGYSFNEHFSLQTNIPYIHRSFRRPNGLGIEEGSESGLGDTTLMGKLLLWNKDTGDGIFTGSLLGGLKFPTGSTSRLRDEVRALSAAATSTGGTHGGTSTTGSATASGIHGYDLTLGSGSFDARIGASVYYSHKRAFFTGAFHYAICSEGDYGYRFANDLTWDGGPGYYLLSDSAQTLALQAAVSGEHKGQDMYRDQTVDSTGFTAVYVGPKITYTWKDRLTAHFGVDFPVSITNSGLQAVPGPRVRAGFTWMLGRSSEPAAGTHNVTHSMTIDGSAPPIWTPTPETRFYGGVEYLHWVVKDAPISIPLVSTGPIDPTHHGFINFSETTILYGAPYGPARGGNNAQAFPGFSGTRVTLGYSLGTDHRFGIEARGFALQSQSAGYEVHSNSAGMPIINIPVLNNVSYAAGGRGVSPPRNEDGLSASLPNDSHRTDGNSGVIMGGVKISNSLQLWGADIAGTVNFYRGSSWELSGLVGARYLDLSETFNLNFDSTGVTGLYAGLTGLATDRFQTRNQFYGGTLGLRGRYFRGRFGAELTGRVALGTTHQMMNISGSYESRNFLTTYSTGAQGVFAQPANSGRTSSERFAVAPEVQLKLSYALTPRWRATVGYDFLYCSSVLRPGDQLNRELPKGQTFGQGMAPPSTTSPARLSNTSDFFAHGLSVGMEFRF